MLETDSYTIMREKNWILTALFVALLIFGAAHRCMSKSHDAVTDSLWQAVKINYKINPEIALDYAKALQGVANKNGNTMQEANALFSIGYLNLEKKHYHNSLEAYFKVLSIYKALGNEAYLASTYRNIGMLFADINIHQEAVKFYLQALPLYMASQNKNRIAESYYLLGRSYVNLNDFENAEIYLNKALKLSNTNKTNRRTYNWLGVLFRKEGSLQKAIDAYHKSLAFCKAGDKGANKTKAMVLLNLGIVHLSLNELDQAKSYAEQSLAISATLDGWNKTIKPQILLTEIATKRKSAYKSKLLGLMNTLDKMDATVFNPYYNEALLFISQKENIDLLKRNEIIKINMHMGAQLKISTELYEAVKRQLDNYALQMVMNKIKTAEKIAALERRTTNIRWGIGILFSLFLGAVFWRFAQLKYKKRRLKQQHEEMIYEVKTRLSVAKQEIMNNELAGIESTMALEQKNAELLALEKENIKLLALDKDNNQVMTEMITDISNANELIKKINAYVKDMREYMKENGFDVPPPPPSLWDLGDERDN